MRSKEVALALLCVLAGGFIGFVLTRAGGTLPSPVVYFTAAIVVLGTALVLVRYDRLGPFEGELGPPRHENAIREQVIRESQRALRYGGEFAVLVVKRRSKIDVNWSRLVRASDTLIHCRRNQAVILLPQSSREGAEQLAARLDVAARERIGVALVHFPEDGIAAEELCPTLLQLMKRASSSDEFQLARLGSAAGIPRPSQAPPTS